VANFVPWPDEEWVLRLMQLFTAVYGTLFIFGFIAFFITYFSHYSRWLNYQMDAAYWVYIIHLPIVAFVPGVIAGIALPAVLKFAITFSTTAIICLASYKYLVRGTFIGMFLNGKVYKMKKLPDETTMSQVALDPQ
jgi:ABC-type antimicrobial peptide transport system permease subunit